jgi:hypothetical protein
MLREPPKGQPFGSMAHLNRSCTFLMVIAHVPFAKARFATSFTSSCGRNPGRLLKQPPGPTVRRRQKVWRIAEKAGASQTAALLLRHRLPYIEPLGVARGRSLNPSLARSRASSIDQRIIPSSVSRASEAKQFRSDVLRSANGRGLHSWSQSISSLIHKISSTMGIVAPRHPHITSSR